jgi:signal transduction histidine kinase
MQLAKRFFTINALTVLATIALTALAAIIFVASYSTLFGSEADMGEIKRAIDVRMKLGEIQKAAQRLPFEQLLEKSFQEELTTQVMAVGADALILKNRQVLFSTAPFSDMEINKSLLLSGQGGERDTLELDGRTFMFARADYRLHSGEEGVLLLLAPIRFNTNFYLSLAIFSSVVFIVTFLVMNVWVSLRFSRGIIAPVSRLKDAAVKISEGDLNWEIAEDGEGEVRELSRTLELMRIKLKESILLQQKYDENRKFLISSISHDLKTPVTSIIGYIDGIIDGVAKTPEKMAEYLKTARSKAMQVNAMIDDLLLYSKLDLNQILYHFEKTDLRQYFEDCLNDHRYEFDKAKIKLTLASELPVTVFVNIDREKFKRVIQNILDNAIRYMDKADGRVEIILRETPSSAVIEIRDNGRGIPEGDLPHIFDRFYRADPARKNADGSGLGLAIAKQIVEGHEGHIWVRSEAGEGTSMLISLKKC